MNLTLSTIILGEISVCKKEFLEAGKIVSTKGLKGEIVVEPWCDSPEFLCSFKFLYLRQGNNKYKVKNARVHKKNAVILLDGIASIDQAHEYIGEVIYIFRKDVQLEQGQYFIQDLIGLEVVDVDDGKKYGEITDVFKTGANDVYQITDKKTRNYLIPVIDEVIIDVQIHNNLVLIRPLKGIFDEI